MSGDPIPSLIADTPTSSLVRPHGNAESSKLSFCLPCVPSRLLEWAVGQDREESRTGVASAQVHAAGAVCQDAS
jgi:hypothetical protein